jgi:hypothetical protein
MKEENTKFYITSIFRFRKMSVVHVLLVSEAAYIP